MSDPLIALIHPLGSSTLQLVPWILKIERSVCFKLMVIKNVKKAAASHGRDDIPPVCIHSSFSKKCIHN